MWGDWKEPVTTTNITTTTIIGLKASTRYQFRIAALNEDVVRTLAEACCGQRCCGREGHVGALCGV